MVTPHSKCSTLDRPIPIPIKLSQKLTCWRQPIFILSSIKRATYLRTDFMQRQASTKLNSRRIKLIMTTAWREAQMKKQGTTISQSVITSLIKNTPISCNRNHKSHSKTPPREATFHIVPFSTKIKCIKANQEQHMKTTEARNRLYNPHIVVSILEEPSQEQVGQDLKLPISRAWIQRVCINKFKSRTMMPIETITYQWEQEMQLTDLLRTLKSPLLSAISWTKWARWGGQHVTLTWMQPSLVALADSITHSEMQLIYTLTMLRCTKTAGLTTTLIENLKALLKTEKSTISTKELTIICRKLVCLTLTTSSRLPKMSTTPERCSTVSVLTTKVTQLLVKHLLMVQLQECLTRFKRKLTELILNLSRQMDFTKETSSCKDRCS